MQSMQKQHDYLINLVSRLGLKFKNLKTFSDGASVMTGVNNGVAAWLWENGDLTHMLNIHCICHHLSLACADFCSQITVLKDFEDVLIQLWLFFRNSPKWLNIYAKAALKMHDLDTIPSNKHDKVVRKQKKAVRTRWLSLHVSVDEGCDECVGLLETLNPLAEEKGSGGAMAKGFANKLKSLNFLKMLYTLTILTVKDWCFTQFSTGMAGWLLLIFWIYLHIVTQICNPSSIHSIISTDVWKMWFIK